MIAQDDKPYLEQLAECLGKDARAKLMEEAGMVVLEQAYEPAPEDEGEGPLQTEWATLQKEVQAATAVLDGTAEPSPATE